MCLDWKTKLRLAALGRDREPRRLVQGAQVRVVTPEVVEEDAGGVRVRERRDAGLAELRIEPKRRISGMPHSRAMVDAPVIIAER